MFGIITAPKDERMKLDSRYNEHEGYSDRSSYLASSYSPNRSTMIMGNNFDMTTARQGKQAPSSRFMSLIDVFGSVNVICGVLSS